jgi:hypothetical protein
MLEPGIRDISFWKAWYVKWRKRIDCLERDRERRSGRRRITVRASQVATAWIAMEWPAMEAHYVMPASWLELPIEARRRQRPPDPVVEYRPAPPAQMGKPGFSMDVIGPYLMTSDRTRIPGSSGGGQAPMAPDEAEPEPGEGHRVAAKAVGCRRSNGQGTDSRASP